jgi:hypothetical protein
MGGHGLYRPLNPSLVSCPNVLLIKIWIELMKPIGVDEGHVMEGRQFHGL